MVKCIGCGVAKQLQNKNKAGFVLKMSDSYCLRCFRIKNYNDLTLQDVKVEDIINKVKKTFENECERFQIYYIVDIFDFNGSRIPQLEELIKNYQVNIVINKIDLLPKSIKLSKIRRYMHDLFSKTCLSHCNIILNSSLNSNFIDGLLNKIKKGTHKNYFIGSSNVGKSSIINQLMKSNKLIPKIVVSNYFNTTMDFIEIALDDQHLIVDTPGFFQNNSIASLMHPSDLKFIFFKKEVKQITYQMKPNNSIFFENLCWIDFISDRQNKPLSFHVFTNAQIKTHRTSLKNTQNYYEKNKQKNILSINASEHRSSEYVFTEKDLGIKYEINISGLGWINFKVNYSFTLVINIPNKNNNVLLSLRKPLT